MKIKLLESLAIHEVQRETIPSGTVIELGDAHAKQLVDRGLATAVQSGGTKRAAPMANKKARPLANKSTANPKGK